MNILPFFMGAQSAPNIAELFATSLYTGTGSAQTITNGIDLAGRGGLVWAKDRDVALGHLLSDTERGITFYSQSMTTSQQSNGLGTEIASVASNGFGLGAGGSFANPSGGDDMVAWSFARHPKFFDVVTFTHTNGVTSNVATALTVPLGLATVKRLDSASDWYTNHRSLTSGSNLRLNTPAAESATNAYVSFSGSTVVFASAAPSGDYVVYVWGHDAGGTGVVQCGTVLGGAEANLGWRPQLILSKARGLAANWFILDVARGFTDDTGGSAQVLRPNESSAETTNNRGYTTSTGFVIKEVDDEPYPYLAIRAPS